MLRHKIFNILRETKGKNFSCYVYPDPVYPTEVNFQRPFDETKYALDEYMCKFIKADEVKIDKYF